MCEITLLKRKPKTGFNEQECGFSCNGLPVIGKVNNGMMTS